jgi:hypothetical protein
MTTDGDSVRGRFVPSSTPFSPNPLQSTEDVVRLASDGDAGRTRVQCRVPYQGVRVNVSMYD